MAWVIDILERRMPPSCSCSRMFRRASRKPALSSACSSQTESAKPSASPAIYVCSLRGCRAIRTALSSPSAWRRASALASRVEAIRCLRAEASMAGVENQMGCRGGEAPSREGSAGRVLLRADLSNNGNNNRGGPCRRGQSRCASVWQSRQ